MSISLEEVRRIAGLARLELDDPSRMAAEMGSILEHMAVLGEAEAEAEAEAGPESVSVMRDDSVTVTPGFVKPENLGVAAEAEFFTVPRLSAMEAE